MSKLTDILQDPTPDLTKDQLNDPAIRALIYKHAEALFLAYQVIFLGTKEDKALALSDKSIDIDARANWLKLAYLSYKTAPVTQIKVAIRMANTLSILKEINPHLHENQSSKPTQNNGDKNP